MPCRHAVSCAPCVRTLLDDKGLEALTCPICRQPVKTVEALPEVASGSGSGTGMCDGEFAWPRRVRLVNGDVKKLADFPTKTVIGGPFAALRATATAKCFPGDATPVVLKFRDGDGMDSWADMDDDGNVQHLVELWQLECRQKGYAFIPTLQVHHATGDAARVAQIMKPQSSVDFPVGTVVVLAMGYETTPDAVFGPLRPGDRGVIVVSDGSTKPYKVAFSNQAFWYQRTAVCLPTAANAAVCVPRFAPRTCAFRHPKHGSHELTWQALGSVWTCDVCRGTMTHAVHRMRCSECDWDCCQLCRDKAELAVQTMVMPATADRPALFVGDNVVRGPQWKWGDQDGGIGRCGVVISRTATGWIGVRWSANMTVNVYRYGTDSSYDITLHDPTMAATNELVVGAVVVLARNFDVIADAARGCLVPGVNHGTIVEIQPNVDMNVRYRGIPGYKVIGVLPDGTIKHWWFVAQALCLLGSPNAAEKDYVVGTQVVLRTGYGSVSDAANGPLRPGNVGTIVEVDGSATPYKVQAANGTMWWYMRRAVGVALRTTGATEVEQWMRSRN